MEELTRFGNSRGGDLARLGSMKSDELGNMTELTPLLQMTLSQDMAILESLINAEQPAAPTEKPPSIMDFTPTQEAFFGSEVSTVKNVFNDLTSARPEPSEGPQLGEFMPPDLRRLGSLSMLGSLSKMDSIPVLKSAKSGDFLDFLKQLAADEDLESKEKENSAEEADADEQGTEAQNEYVAQIEDEEEDELFQPNEPLFQEALETTSVHHLELKRYFLNEERAGDILWFHRDRLPCFQKEKIRRDGRDKGDKSNQKEQQNRTVTRISDKQVECICSLKPKLMFPSDKTTWKFEELKGETCAKVRNTPAAKKELENYKYTGFCKDHIQGTNLGSRQHWLKHKRCTIRGFNLERNVNDRRMRHLLCLDTKKGNVFLKWCTQCHLWKNFRSFSVREKSNQLTVHTFCAICHQRQVQSRDKRRIERAKKRKLAEVAAGGVKDVDLEEVAAKLLLRKKSKMDPAAVKVFALESTHSKFVKFSKTIFENIDETPVICGVFSGTPEDMVVLKAMEVLVDLQANPLRYPQLLGSGRWLQVAQELLTIDVGSILSGNSEGTSLTRQDSLDFWAKPAEQEKLKFALQQALQVDELRYKIVLLGALLVEARLSSLLSCSVTLEALYEGCILMAFTLEMPPENNGKIYITSDQVMKLRKMGWSALSLKYGDEVRPLIEGPVKHTNELLEIIEMLGVKCPPKQLIEKQRDLLTNLYPLCHIYISERNPAALLEEGEKQNMKERSFEILDWQGCTALHHAVLHAGSPNDETFATLQFLGATCCKQNRRGFTPLEVAGLANPSLVPHLLNSLCRKATRLGKLKPAKEMLTNLVKTLETAMQHIKNGLMKRHAYESLQIVQLAIQNNF